MEQDTSQSQHSNSNSRGSSNSLSQSLSPLQGYPSNLMRTFSRKHQRNNNHNRHGRLRRPSKEREPQQQHMESPMGKVIQRSQRRVNGHYKSNYNYNYNNIHNYKPKKCSLNNCQLPKAPIVTCNSCRRKFHTECIGIPQLSKESLIGLRNRYKCNECKGKDENQRKEEINVLNDMAVQNGANPKELIRNCSNYFEENRNIEENRNVNQEQQDLSQTSYHGKNPYINNNNNKQDEMETNSIHSLESINSYNGIIPSAIVNQQVRLQNQQWRI